MQYTIADTVHTREKDWIDDDEYISSPSQKTKTNKKIWSIARPGPALESEGP